MLSLYTNCHLLLRETCKSDAKNMNRDIHNRVYLWETTREIELHELLTVWMGNLKYDGIRRHIDGNAKFIKEERLHRNVTPSFKQIHDWYS